MENTLPSLHYFDARSFLGECAHGFRWGDLSEDFFMDVGCGKDRVCCELLVRIFPNVGRVIGLDKDPQVVELARQQNQMPNIAYECADIENRESLLPYEGRLTKIVSTHCFHQLDNKEEAFRNVYYMLKAGGEAGFLFCLRSGIYGWVTDLIANPKWKQYYQTPDPVVAERYSEGIDETHFREMMTNIGFHVILCQKDCRMIPYPNDCLCKLSLSTCAKQSFNVPDNLSEEFEEDVFRGFVAHNGRNEEGKPCYASTVLSLLVKKPEARR